jgi:HK97 gp10 family phage protein
MAQSVRVRGLKELGRALDRMDWEIGKAIMGRVLAAAGEPMRAAAEAKAPRLTGALAGSIDLVLRLDMQRDSLVYATLGPAMGEYRQLKPPTVATVKRGRKLGKRTYQVGSTPGVYGLFNEFGTADTPAQPFLRPAWEAHKTGAIERIASGLRVEIAKAQQKVSVRA